MNRFIRAGLAAAAIAATATPAFAASRFTTVKYIRVPITAGPQGVVMHGHFALTPAAASLTSDDDRTWTLTLDNCTLRISGDGLALSTEDADYKKSFAAGVTEADNPLKLELMFDGRAEVVKDTPGGTQAPVACDAHRVYWVSLLGGPGVPGSAILELVSLDGYKAQETEQRMLLLSPATFLKDDTKPASELGGFTAALAKTIGK